MQFGILTLGDHLPDPGTGVKASQQERISSIIDAATRAEQLGFTHASVGEHHFSDYIVSSPVPILAAIAARTTTMRLGTGVSLIPTLDPVRVAEDFSTLDLLSGGRAEIVVGRGISTEVYDVFGVDYAQSHDAFEENVHLLQQLWTQESVTFASKFRPPLNQTRLEPRPLQTPHPPIWLGVGLSEESMKRVGRLGMPLMLPSIFKRPEDYKDLVTLYREEMTANGCEDRIMVGCASHIHVGANSSQAKSEWKPYVMQYADWANGLRGVSFDLDYDRLINGPAICGSPDEVTERIAGMHELLKPDLHLLLFDLGGLPHEQLIETIELFGSDVLPKLL